MTKKVSTNLEIFYKAYVVKAVLGIDPLQFCGVCGKVLLEQREIDKNE